jgi:hypothetical protein
MNNHPRSFKEFVIKSLFVRATFRDRELQELEKLRKIVKTHICKYCGGGISITQLYSHGKCAICENRACYGCMDKINEIDDINFCVDCRFVKCFKCNDESAYYYETCDACRMIYCDNCILEHCVKNGKIDI